MAISSLSLKIWAIIILWFVFAPIAHRWDLGPLYVSLCIDSSHPQMHKTGFFFFALNYLFHYIYISKVNTSLSSMFVPIVEFFWVPLFLVLEE